MATKLDIIPIKQWMNDINHPFIISGPCSAETENQVMETAHELARIPEVKVYRAGIWKPRTRPNYFEGVGKQGLKWLQRVKEETGLKVAVEVASPQHVEECLKHDIDIFWLGARTVVNPFSVQEITEALKGVQIPIMIKNPVNPDLKLWIGAIERVYAAGVTKLVAIHRGFYSLNKSLFRNPPMWEMPIELKREIPNLPILVDPSHISGTPNLIPHISQKAMDLEMDGLMIESHYRPSSALSDAEQQITPEQLKDLLKNLVIRDRSENSEFQNKLAEYRTQIDEIDDELLNILSKRMDIVNEIGLYKKDQKITILQLKRWSFIIENRIKKGINLGLHKEFLIKTLKLIHLESMRIQTEIMNIHKQKED